VRRRGQARGRSAAQRVHRTSQPAQQNAQPGRRNRAAAQRKAETFFHRRVACPGCRSAVMAAVVATGTRADAGHAAATMSARPPAAVPGVRPPTVRAGDSPERAERKKPAAREAPPPAPAAAPPAHVAAASPPCRHARQCRQKGMHAAAVCCLFRPFSRGAAIRRRPAIEGGGS